MQLKSNVTRNQQFMFYKKANGRLELDFVHVPGGATVEIEDDIFKAICAGKTEVSIVKEVIIPLDKENIGAAITNGDEQYVIKEYFETGVRKTLSLMETMIENGDFTVVERVKVSMDVIDKFLVEHKIDVKGMDEDTKLALYDKLA